MSDDQNSPAEKWDPLTSPYWEPRDEESSSVESKFKQSEEEVQITSTNIPLPPDVDQILRGEYTGWVPLIKPGDSIESATVRFEVDNAKRQEESKIQKSVSFDDMFESKIDTSAASRVTPEDLSEIKDAIREMKSETDVYVKDFYPNFREIAENPDTVASPAQALEEARRRIEQMRANLQVNLSRVQQSFDHPIFDPKLTDETTDEVLEDSQEANPVVKDEPQPVVFDYVPNEQVAPEVHAEEVHTEQVHTEQVHTEQVATEQVHQQAESQQTGQVFTTTNVVSEEPKKEDHSLELVIMRDEIKDLRDRLDASQKLIETLMERLANLAELALTSRRD